MCMLIHHPPDAEPFTRPEFADFHRKNPHGFGAAWIEDGQLFYAKSMATLDESWARYEELRAKGVGEMVLHWRLRTSGPTSEKLCHPFLVGSTLVFHNGVLDWRHTPEMSDTTCFIADYLGPALRRRRGRISTKFHRALAQKIGSGNKLALWTAGEAKPHIVGESRGLWYRGRWYSNTYAWTMPIDARRYQAAKRTYSSLDADDATGWNDEEWVDGMGWLPLLPRHQTDAQRAYAEKRAGLRKQKGVRA